jgi:ATP-dependent Clp protease ATP-binding subunit ClpA
LALVASPSASGAALRACGLDYDRLMDDVADLPSEYYGNHTAGSATTPRPLQWRRTAQELVARAEGMAAGLGSSQVGETHVLLALLWERQSCVAISLIERRGITRARVLEELGRRGVKLPDVPLPTRPNWGPPLPVPEDEYLSRLADLRRAGKVYRTACKDGQHYISMAEAPHDSDS